MKNHPYLDLKIMSVFVQLGLQLEWLPCYVRLSICHSFICVHNRLRHTLYQTDPFKITEWWMLPLKLGRCMKTAQQTCCLANSPSEGSTYAVKSASLSLPSWKRAVAKQPRGGIVCKCNPFSRLAFKAVKERRAQMSSSAFTSYFERARERAWLIWLKMKKRRQKTHGLNEYNLRARLQ